VPFVQTSNPIAGRVHDRSPALKPQRLPGFRARVAHHRQQAFEDEHAAQHAKELSCLHAFAESYLLMAVTFSIRDLTPTDDL